MTNMSFLEINIGSKTIYGYFDKFQQDKHIMLPRAEFQYCKATIVSPTFAYPDFIDILETPFPLIQ